MSATKSCSRSPSRCGCSWQNSAIADQSESAGPILLGAAALGAAALNLPCQREKIAARGCSVRRRA